MDVRGQSAGLSAKLSGMREEHRREEQFRHTGLRDRMGDGVREGRSGRW